MFTKPEKTNTHKRLEVLQKRKPLSVEEHQLLRRLSKGYSGEVRFFRILQSELQCSPIQLFNLYLKINGSDCQIDCLLIFQNELILFEIKNYQGDFLLKDNKWYILSNSSQENIKNPLNQLQRTELMLHQLLKEKQIPLTIKSYLIFVHPEFILYQAPLNLPLILPGQLKRFIRTLQNTPSATHQYHHDIANMLKQKHNHTPAYDSGPIYDYNHLKKGVICEKCCDSMEVYDTNMMRCMACGFTDSFESATVKTIEEFNTLFPDQKMTVKSISEWTDHHATKYKIRTVLAENYFSKGDGRGAYYSKSNPAKNK